MDISNLSKKNQAIIVAKEKGYTVKDGDVFSKNKKLKLALNEDGYYLFGIRYKGIKYTIQVSRFVAYQKFGAKLFEQGIQVRHLDSNSKNNLESNIAIGTASQNAMDKPAEIRKSMAIHASSFSKKHNHEDILRLHKEGKSYKQIMEILGTKSKGTISFIINKSISSKEGIV